MTLPSKGPLTELSAWRSKARDMGIVPPSCASEVQRRLQQERRRTWRWTTEEWLESHSALAGMLLALRPPEDLLTFDFPRGQRVARQRAEKHAQSTDLGREQVPRGFRNSLTIFRRARRQLEAAGIRLSVLFISSRERVLLEWARRSGVPVPDDFAELVAKENALTERYAAFFEKEGVPHIDAIDAVVGAFAEEVEAGRDFYPTHNDVHPFERGYAAYARAAHELWKQQRRD